jgi:hypothetical protein
MLPEFSWKNFVEGDIFVRDWASAEERSKSWFWKGVEKPESLLFMRPSRVTRVASTFLAGKIFECF